VRGGTAIILATTAVVGVTAGPAQAVPSCEQLDASHEAMMGFFNYYMAVGSTFEVTGNMSLANYYYSLGEIWYYRAQNIQLC
jgi:hypothetical protein